MKFLQKKFVLPLIFCALQLGCLHAKKFGGGGGGFRGGGAARANPPPAGGGGHFGGGGAPVGGGQPHFAGGGGGFRPQGGASGGFHPPPAGGFHGPSMSAGSGPGRFGSGTGLGSSSRAGTFTSALAGAAVGTVGTLVAFEAGKAIIRSFDRPIHHDGRDYYWGEEYAKKRNGEIQCKMPWDTLVKQSAASNQSSNGTSEQPSLANATFSNGSRPKEIVWTCKEHVEICCGMDCCPNPQYNPSSNSDGKSGGGGMGTVGKVLLGILIVGLLCCCCCALITYTSCRSLFDSCMPGSNSNNQNYDQDHSYKYDNQQQTGQAYPMQPYYPPPPSNNYPAQPQAPTAYPPAPTYPAQPQASAVYPAAPTSYPQATGY